MASIRNDIYGIESKVTYKLIKKMLHPLTSKFRIGINKNKALKTTILAFNWCDEIENLDFLKFFPNLKTLVLNSKKLSNIDGLKYTPLLNILSITSDWPGIVDISAISHCKELDDLDFSFTYYSDMNYNHYSKVNIRGFEALARLRKIRFLSLYNMGITNIGFITSMDNLEDIDFSKNPINDLSPLQGVQSIIELDLSNCGITDITVLTKLSNLKFLNISNNQIKDFMPLKSLKMLTEVTVYNSGLLPEEVEKWKQEFQHIECFDFEE